MTIRKITEFPEKVLAETGKPVTEFGDDLAELCNDMFATMYDAEGVGLAAPQIGRSLRISVIEIPDTEDILTLINPQIVKRSGERIVEEGCLSIPGYVAEITRSQSVTVKALNRHGRPLRVRAKEDILAHALEHEMDHLNGILYIDYLESPDQLIKLEPAEAAAATGDESG